MPRIYQSPAKLSQFGLSSAGLTAALAAVNHVEIDRNVTLSSAITIPYGKTISFSNRAVINATALLKIEGNLIASRERIFSNGSLVKFGQSAVDVVYPEWWGARAMKDCRQNSVSSENIDCTAYLQAAIDCVTSIHNFDDEYTRNTIILSGVYGVTSKLVVKNKTVNFIGTSCYFDGTGFRFIGTLTGEEPQDYILEFDGADNSRVENVCFKGKRTTNDAIRMIGAVNFMCSIGGSPQRHLKMHHVNIGDRIGHWSDSNPGFEFENGFVCGLEGAELNNDFFSFFDIGIGNTRVGILNNLNMAVDWTIDKYSFAYGETMVSYPAGGTFTGREWYPALSTTGGYLIKCGATQDTTVRFEIYNFDCEHLPIEGFVWGAGTVRGTFTNGHMAANTTSIAGDGCKLLAGTANIYDPILIFNNISFHHAGTKPYYLDCSNSSGSRGFFQFNGCTSVDGLHVKMPLTSSRATMYIDINGRKPANDNDISVYLKVSLNNSNPYINGTTGLVLIGDLLSDGSTDLPYKEVLFGLRGYGGLTRRKTINSFKTSTATNTLTFNTQIPARMDIRGVTVTFHTSGVIGGTDYVKVGDGTDDEKFGRITGSGSFVQNTYKCTGGLIYTTATNVVLKSFNASNVATNMTAGKYIVLTIDYEEFGVAVSEMSANALALLPNDDAL